mgnify:CR=1 FL=1
MALELLAGPLDVLMLDATPVTDIAGQTQAFWDDATGLSCYSSTVGGMSVAQMDGTICLRSDFSPGYFTLDTQTPGTFLVSGGSNQTLYEYQKAPAVQGALIGSNGVNWSQGLEIRTADRYVHFLGATVYYKSLASTATAWTTTEATLSLTRALSDLTPTCSLTDTQDVIAVAYVSGEIAFYNVVTKLQVGQNAYVPANIGAWYSRKHKVWIVLDDTNAISVYSTTVLPDSLSAVTADTPMKQGGVSRVRVQLTGDEGEPCAGEIVTWGETGPGTLAQVQSTTDADGWAVNDYAVPPNATVTAAIEITAEVAF